MSKKIIKLAFCFSLVIGPVAFAQEAAEAAPEDTGPKVEQTTLWQMVKQGGWSMYPLGLFSVGMVFFVVQNALSLREKVLLRPDLMPDCIQLMKDKKVLDAHSLCKENETLFTYVFAAGLERCSTKGEINYGKVKEAIEEASTEEVTQYMKAVA